MAARAAVVLGLAATALVFVIRPLSIATPGSGLDESWIAVLGEATTRPIRWGVDLAFSYGPASTLLTRYFTDRYFGLNLPVALATALASAACFALLIRPPNADRTALVLAFGLAQALGLASQASQDMDAFILALALNLYLLDLVRPDRSPVARCVLVFGAVLLGIYALAKTSLGLFGFVMLVLADCRSITVRRGPWLTLAFLLGALGTFLGFGQRLGDLPAFIATQWSFAAGYGDAMWIDGNAIELSAYVAASFGLVVLAAANRCPGHENRWAALGVAGALLLGLKAGFVRADSHTQIAWSLLGFSGLSVGTALVLPRSVRTASAIGVACLACVWVWAPLVLILDTHRPKQWSELAAVYSGMMEAASAETIAWTQWLQDPAAFAEGARADKASSWDSLREQYRLPRLEGTVDMLASQQSSILANQLDYRPRPSFQEYATYDPRLMAANVAFYAGRSRPDWVLFGLKPIDGRYPAFTEGALWPILLSHYDPVGLAGTLLVLRSRAGSPPDALSPLQRIVTSMETPIVPPPGGIFARIRTRKTLFGQLASLLFRVPGLGLHTVTADGTERSFRFVPAIAEAGFLLSPQISDAAQFARLAQAKGFDAIQVVSLSIVRSGLGAWVYRPEISVEFETVALKPGNPADMQDAARRLGLEQPAP